MQVFLRLFAVAALLLFTTAAQAWWNNDWSQRAKLTLDAGPAGADLKGPVSEMPVLVRLHAGNFDFTKAKPDGSDLRFVAADDKTPLKHYVEKWDAQGELALVWVKVPSLAPGPAPAPAALWLYYGNAKAASVGDAKGVLDAQHVVVYHFAENDGAPADATAYANNAALPPAARNPAAIIGTGAVFNGADGLLAHASPSLKFSASPGITFSAWLKLDGPSKGTVVSAGDKGKGVSLALDGLALTGAIDQGRSVVRARGGALSAGDWHHVALVAGKRLVLYLDGVEVASAAGEVPEFDGFAQIGRGFSGEMDEVEISAAARPADWIRAAARGQGIDAALVALGDEGESGGGTSSYIGILLNSVTIDGWVVIGFLGVMLLVSFWVMAAKTMYINRNERENGAFLHAFHDGSGLLEVPEGFAVSSLSHVYRAGADEVKGRLNGAAAAAALSPKAIESIRATIDAARVREGQKLNRFMVLLTIAISGGPFLGLLGTVIGVMITFAAIAATGDVNVAAIAPGIAAALVATVAGLAVAIPALFGYNYIGTRIRNITADMQVFADEFLARIAEKYEA